MSDAASKYLDLGTVRVCWGNLAAKNGDTVTVTFPGGGFSAAPTVIPTSGRTYNGGGVGALTHMTVDSVSATQLVARVVNNADSTSGGAAGADKTWLAIGSKP